jgi:hypothetical protein
VTSTKPRPTSCRQRGALFDTTEPIKWISAKCTGENVTLAYTPCFSLWISAAIDGGVLTIGVSA